MSIAALIELLQPWDKSMNKLSKQPELREELAKLFPLAAELLNLDGILCLCFEGTKNPRFVLDLHKREFYSTGVVGIYSTSFMFSTVESLKNKLVICGHLHGSSQWEVSIRRPKRSETPQWIAAVTIYKKSKFTCDVYEGHYESQNS